MARARSWQEFLLRVTAVFVIVSGAGIAATVAALLLLGRWRLIEHQVLMAAAVPAVLVATVVQSILFRRWLQATRRWYAGAGSDDARVFRELLRFPWIGSATGFAFWAGTTTVIALARLLALPPDVPLYRTVLLLATSLSIALVAWPVQFFIFRRIVFRLLEQLTVDRAVVQRTRRQPILRKYTAMFGMLLCGAVIFDCALAYGLNRNVLVDDYLDDVQRLLMSIEELVYDHEFQGAVDVQGKLDLLNAGLRGHVRIVTRPAPEAVTVERRFAAAESWHGLPFWTVEAQAIPETLVVARPLLRSGQRQAVSYLEYAVPTAPLDGALFVVLWKLLLTGTALIGLILVTSVVFLLDLSRPIRLIRDRLHPGGESFLSPPLVVSDDELLAFSAGVQGMFLRLRSLFTDLLRAYWDVKDERAGLQATALRFQQRTQRDGSQIQVVATRLRQLTDHVHDLGQQLEAMDKVAETVHQATRLMQDTIGQVQSEIVQIRARVRIAHDWIGHTGDDLGATRRAMTGLDRWVSEATQDFDQILRRFHDLVAALNPVDLDLSRFHERVVAGTENVRTTYHVLSSETERYANGILLIERAQDRLDEVMRDFQQVEAIREQIDMLSFQAAVVASQSQNFERDFRVVADEIRDLSERAAAGIQRIFTAIWLLDQQGKQTLQRILNSRHALGEALDVSRQAHGEAQKGAELSGGFANEMHEVAEVIRDEAGRTGNLVESLREPFTRGAQLKRELQDIDETFQSVAQQMQRLDEISRTMDARVHEQQEGLRATGTAVDRMAMAIRDLMSAGEGVILQSRTLRSILDRLVGESRETATRVERTLEDLRRIEAEVFRNEAEVKRVSSELQSA